MKRGSDLAIPGTGEEELTGNIAVLMEPLFQDGSKQLASLCLGSWQAKDTFLNNWRRGGNIKRVMILKERIMILCDM